MGAVVTTVAGQVEGFFDEGSAVFLGVPFAAPPFGPNRFAAPAPPQPWEGVRPALAYAPTAPQPHRQFTLIPEPVMDGDDCLNLNVFTPDPAARLPVLVWIHGGGFTAGCNASPWYRGVRFSRDGIVVVSVNYRLGAEGFLPIDGAPTNRGVRDWLAALAWVRDNISAFGGDADRVTIAGQSAGGMACATLLMSPAARGLFRSAICMSGARVPVHGPPGGLVEAIAAELGVAATRDGFASRSAAELVVAQETATQGLTLPLGPVPDGDVVAAGYGDVGGVPVLVGATEEEATASFAAVPGGVDEARLARRLGRMGLAPDALATYRAAYPDAEPWYVLGQATSDLVFKAPVTWLADAVPTAWAYNFEWRSTVAGLGAVHCLDVPFAFDVLDAPGVVDVTGPEPPQHLADAVHGAWVRFITDGDPGWERYDRRRRQSMAFDETSKLVDDPWRLARTIWPVGFATAR